MSYLFEAIRSRKKKRGSSLKKGILIRWKQNIVYNPAALRHKLYASNMCENVVWCDSFVPYEVVGYVCRDKTKLLIATSTCHSQQNQANHL